MTAHASSSSWRCRPPRRAGPAPRLLDEDVAHGAGGGEEEVPPGLPTDVALVGEPQVRLMHQGRRLQGLPGRQVGHAVTGELVQLLVHDRQELIRRRGVAGLGGPQQLGDTFDRLAGHELGNSRKKVGAISLVFSALELRTARAIRAATRPPHCSATAWRSFRTVLVYGHDPRPTGPCVPDTWIHTPHEALVSPSAGVRGMAIDVPLGSPMEEPAMVLNRWFRRSSVPASNGCR
jgi:hypothetical protein